MSIQITSKIWASGEEKGAALLVWLALAEFANDEGKCWPAVHTVADRCGRSERYIQTIMRELEGRGRIKPLYRIGHSTMYQVLSPEPLPTLGGEPCITPTPEARITPSGEPCITPGVNPASPRTVIEPSLEPSLEPSRESTRKTRVLPSTQKGKDVIHDAIAEVTKKLPGSFNGKVTAQLKTELPDKTPEYIAAEVWRRFGPGGLWYQNDWRGRKNSPPTPQQIYEEWNRVLGGSSKAPQDDTAARRRYIEGPFAAFIEH